MIICPIEKCTGCYACINSCPNNCISMVEGQCGHIQPLIDDSSCIECDVCQKVCAVNSPQKLNTPRVCYAVWSKNETDRQTSASGGAASVFSSTVVRDGGKVFGVKIDDNFNVHHTMASSEEELIAFKDSKYVQSHVNLSYRQAKEQLILGKRVLFIGTPCQVGGLLSYLGKPYKNLITCDLICHGVPSQRLLRDDVHLLSRRESLSGLKISFRSEKTRSLKLFENGNMIASRGFDDDYYYLGFMKGLFYRPSCYQCKYATHKRVSDITIGDFWGLGKKIPFNTDGVAGGVSVVLCNTEKGKGFFSECSNQFIFTERLVDEAVEGNAQLRGPSNRHINADLFSHLYDLYGFEKAAQCCLKKEKIKYKLLFTAFKLPFAKALIETLKR